MKRARLWEIIIGLRVHFQNPWCMGGDYDEVRSIAERKGCSRRDKGMHDFNNFVEQLELVDLPMLGRNFTWCNSIDGGRWSKIDKFLMDPVWLEKFRFKLWGLPRNIFDHCPLLLMEDEKNWGPKPFRFINAWTLYPNF